MSTRTQTSSMTKRFSLSVNKRITDGLLSSSGTVAVIGLISATITLLFVIWFVLELQQQSRVGAPLARAAAVLNASINQSLSALRGWVAYGQPHSRTERGRIWSEQIEPTLAQLAHLSTSTDDELVMGQVTELKNLLQDLKVIQWAIEDVAKTPGNRPATVAYETRLHPLRANLLRSLQSAIDHYSTNMKGGSALAFLAHLARFRSAFTQADRALSSYVTHADQIYAHNVEQQLQRARRQVVLISEQLPEDAGPDVLAVLEFAASEFSAYDQQVAEIIYLQQSSDWNVAQHLYIHEAQPIVLRAARIAGDLAESQARAMASRADYLTNASYLVTAMALLMGLLSAGSLFVSVRLKQQVASVMAEVKMLGQYEIERLIGRGGMGEVYLGHHAMLRRPTAIKLLRADNMRDINAQNRFQREVKLTCQLSHPNTIEIFDYGRTAEGVFYYAMEYLDGFGIDDLVEVAGPVAPGRVLHILMQACGSLREAHERGFLHRDLKPSNMMLTNQGGVHDTLKILDFGLVMDLAADDAQAEDEFIAGTPKYLAPECVLTANSCSPQSDLYALGAVAYFMLCGCPISTDDDIADILSQQLQGDIPFPSSRLGRELPEDLEYVVMSCLSPDPGDRPSSASRLIALLDQCDCKAWTDEDASHWWATWGEAARSRSSPGGDDEALSASGFEVALNKSPT